MTDPPATEPPATDWVPSDEPVTAVPVDDWSHSTEARDPRDPHDAPYADGATSGPVDRRGRPIVDTPVPPRTARRRRRRRGRGFKVVLVLLILSLPFLGAFGWFVYQLDPPGSPGKQVAVTIKPGWGVGNIGDELARDHVIGSSLAFKLYAAATGSRHFEAGKYTLHEDLGVRPAIDVLKRGPKIVVQTLALPPGLTIKQIADRVGNLPGRNAAAFLQLAQSGVVRSRYSPPGNNSLEGLTYPDTYSFAPTDDDTTILKTIVAHFDAAAATAGIDAPPAGITPYQAVVVASLVQREAGVAEDRAPIAAVVYNRLKLGMPLQIDATLLYARGDASSAPTNADKKIQSPYNTYLNKGLPPTPIATVTPESLAAALHPANVPYLYYVVIDKSGKSAFATTLAEHNQNVAEARAKGLL
ncbi:MAG: hypothetical protein JWL73_162 [Actinomycetia bacterium]|nr:hypothetical protein [Actinomycetes bacterium]